MTIPMYSGEIPYVTTEQMIEVDGVPVAAGQFPTFST